MKPFFTVVELAHALGMSRWGAQRWLASHEVPYVQVRRGRPGRRGTRIHVMLSDLRTYAPKFCASVEEGPCGF